MKRTVYDLYAILNRSRTFMTSSFTNEGDLNEKQLMSNGP